MRHVACALPIILSSFIGVAGAQDLEPRLYSNLPLDINFLVLGYTRSVGNVLIDPAIELENADLTSDGPILGYARSLGFGGLSGKFDIGLANLCLSGSATFEGELFTRDVCGWSDARLRIAVNFLGAPALKLREFAGYRQNLVVGASLQLSAPIGDYDPDRLVNIGTNRWAAKTEIGVSKAVNRWLFELALAGTFYEENDDFFGGRTRKQDPIYSLQAHLVRSFDRGIWIALDATQYQGGQTQTGGVVDRNRQSNSRFGLTLSVPINSHHSVKINASSGVETRTGSDFDTVGLAWQYRWGPAT